MKYRIVIFKKALWNRQQFASSAAKVVFSKFKTKAGSLAQMFIVPFDGIDFTWTTSPNHIFSVTPDVY